MEKIGIIIDSSCGLNKEEAESKGFFYAPIIIEYNGEERKVGVNIDNDFLIKNIDKSTKIKTAAVPMGVMNNLITKAKKKYDSVIVITISKFISSGNNNAKIVAKKFDNVYVFDSFLITPWIEHILDTIEILAEGGRRQEIIDLLSMQKNVNYALLAPSSLEFLYHGGRINKAQYLTGNLLKIFPIIPVIGGNISGTEVIKARTEKKAAKKIASILKKEYDAAIKKGYEVECASIGFNAPLFEAILNSELKKVELTPLVKTKITSEIIAHIGPTAVGAGIRIKNPYDNKKLKQEIKNH